MKADRAPHLAALVIKWPQAISAATARDVVRRLVENRLPATWSLDQVGQIEALASWGAARSGAEAALIVPSTSEDTDPTAEQAAVRELSRRLELLRSSGMGVDVVHAAPELTAGHWPRTLRAVGVHGIVVDSERDTGLARALPFGVWQFTPQATVPRRPHWTNWFRAPRPAFAPLENGSPAVVAIDLSQVGAARSRAWRQVEEAVSEAVEARASGSVAMATMSEIAARFTQASASRPQRSILRAA